MVVCGGLQLEDKKNKLVEFDNAFVRKNLSQRKKPTILSKDS